MSEDEAEEAWRALDGFVAGWEVTVEAVDVIELIEPRWRLVERHPLRPPWPADGARAGAASRRLVHR